MISRSPRVRTALRIFSGACWLLAAYFLWRWRWLRALACIAAAIAPAVLLHPTRKRIGFALTAVVLSTLLTIAAVAGFDLYLHHHFADKGGYNIWGYRGPVAKPKPSGEWRVVMLGGSVAFGYGVAANETIPWYLDQKLNEQRKQSGRGPASVINLGWNGEGAYAFKDNLQLYESLGYDAAILYSGYNDSSANNLNFRHDSAVFRMTGYLPILPVINLRNWLQIADLQSVRENDRVVFRPDLAAAEAVEIAGRINKALEQQLGRLTQDSDPEPLPAMADCGERWNHYCQAVYNAAAYALSRGKEVFVVTEPYISDTHIWQQAALASMLMAKFAGNPKLHYVNLGRAVDLKDPTLCYDGMHLTARGNAQIAERLATELPRAVRR